MSRNHIFEFTFFNGCSELAKRLSFFMNLYQSKNIQLGSFWWQLLVFYCFTNLVWFLMFRRSSFINFNIESFIGTLLVTLFHWYFINCIIIKQDDIRKPRRILSYHWQRERALYQSLVTNYQPLVTSQYSVVTSYSSLVTSCQLLATSYWSLGTTYQLLVTAHCYQLLRIVFEMKFIRYQNLFLGHLHLSGIAITSMISFLF